MVPKNNQMVDVLESSQINLSWWKLLIYKKLKQKFKKFCFCSFYAKNYIGLLKLISILKTAFCKIIDEIF